MGRLYVYCRILGWNCGDFAGASNGGISGIVSFPTAWLAPGIKDNHIKPSAIKCRA